MLKQKTRMLFVALLLLLITALTGCASGIKGRAQADPLLLKTFRNYQLNHNYQYYLYAAGNNYYALLGLAPQFTVPIHKMWKPIAIDDPEMEAVSNFLWEKFPSYSRNAYHLIDPAGQVIGELYTSATFSYLIDEDNTLTFYIDTPWMRDNYIY